MVLEGDEEEIFSWEGPKKPPQSPIICDQEIVYTKPVFRMPRRMMQAINRQTDVPKTTAPPAPQTGPPKEPLSPINCTEEMIHSKPVFRQPRQRLQKENNRGSRTTSETDTGSGPRLDSEQNTGSNADNSKEHFTSADGEFNNLKAAAKPCQNKPVPRHIPPRDPLCHVPNVTPPCPIVPDQRETPLELRTYTHVSEKKNPYTREFHFPKTLKFVFT